MVEGEGSGWHRQPRRHSNAALRGWRDRMRSARETVATKTRFLRDPKATQKITEAITIGSVIAGTMGDINRIRGKKQSDPMAKAVYESPLLTMAYNPRTHQIQNPFLKQVAYVQLPNGKYEYFFNVASPEDAMYQVQMRGDIPVGQTIYYKGAKDVIKPIGKKVEWGKFVERLGQKGDFERLAEMALTKSQSTAAAEERQQEKDLTGLLARYVWKKGGELSLGNLARLEELSGEKDEEGNPILPLVLDPADQARLDVARARLRELKQKYGKTSEETAEIEKLEKDLEPTMEYSETTMEKLAHKQQAAAPVASSAASIAEAAKKTRQKKREEEPASSPRTVYATPRKTASKTVLKEDVGSTLEYLRSVEHAKKAAAAEQEEEMRLRTDPRTEFVNKATGRPNDRAFNLAVKVYRDEQGGYLSYEDAATYVASLEKHDPDAVVDLAMRAKGLGYVG